MKIISSLILSEMNTKEVTGNRNEQLGKLVQKFAILTENDQMFEQGKNREIMGRIQVKFSRTKEDLLKLIDPKSVI